MPSMLSLITSPSFSKRSPLRVLSEPAAVLPEPLLLITLPGKSVTVDEAYSTIS